MGILRDTEPPPGGPPNTPLFPSDSILSRVTGGGYKPTDADLAELHKLAQSGNRAERRAAARHLKKLGIAAPQPEPRVPVVTPAVGSTARAEPAPAGSAARSPLAHRLKPVPAKEAPARPARELKQSPAPKASREKPAAKEAAAKKPSTGKAPAKTAGKEAARKAASGKPAPRKTATKQAAVTKATTKKTTKKPTKKAAAKKAASRKPAVKKAAPKKAAARKAPSKLRRKS